MKNLVMDNPIIIPESMNILSECCGSKPVGALEMVHEILTGICSECNDWSDFNEEEEFVDWADEVEYIREHL
tara:strand:- start:1770 stop:1985 length:216 start_codon:yes stop_codon:yes gene_type:complete